MGACCGICGANKPKNTSSELAPEALPGKINKGQVKLSEIDFQLDDKNKKKKLVEKNPGKTLKRPDSLSETADNLLSKTSEDYVTAT